MHPRCLRFNRFPLLLSAVTLSLAFLPPQGAHAQNAALPAAAAINAPAATEPVDMAVMARIREEGMNRSHLPQTLSYLTDVIGPRLTGSPGLKRANDWTRDKLAEWGLVNAHLEPWGPFGAGWSSERFSAQVVEPLHIPLIAVPKAWSPGWNGTRTAEVVYLDATSEAGLMKYKGTLKGKFVLISPLREMAAHFTPEGRRYTEEELAAFAQATASPAGGPRGGGGGGAPAANLTREQRRELQARAAAQQFAPRRLRFLLEEGAALAMDNPRGDGGTIFVQSASVSVPVTPAPTTTAPGQARPRISPWTKAAEGKIVPQVSLSGEHYNRLVRMIQAGNTVKVAVELKTRLHDDNKGMVYNTVAEIPGMDKADEVVMCGAHIDSWHGGTGATDNGAGVSVCMEAVRILKTLGLKPRRTIRIALWSGEEQGIFGSRAYVAEHFGTRDMPKPEASKFAAYFNLDNGTGKIRGVWCQSNPAVMPIFAEWLKPFNDLGATTVSLRNTGSTDHIPFDAVGLPGFQFIQDSIEYNTRTHHSNQDVYDRIQTEDLKQAATIMAAFLYNAATRDEKLPRKPIAPSVTAGAR